MSNSAMLSSARRAINQFIDARYKDKTFVEGQSDLVGYTNNNKPVVFFLKKEKHLCWFKVTSFNEEKGRWFFEVYFTDPNPPAPSTGRSRRGYQPQRHQAPPAAPQ